MSINWDSCFTKHHTCVWYNTYIYVHIYIYYTSEIYEAIFIYIYIYIYLYIFINENIPNKIKRKTEIRQVKNIRWEVSYVCKYYCIYFHTTCTYEELYCFILILYILLNRKELGWTSVQIWRVFVHENVHILQPIFCSWIHWKIFDILDRKMALFCDSSKKQSIQFFRINSMLKQKYLYLSHFYEIFKN